MRIGPFLGRANDIVSSLKAVIFNHVSMSDGTVLFSGLLIHLEQKNRQ